MAQSNLGMLYAEGMGVPQNFSEALRWFRKAEAAGDPLAADDIQGVLERQHQKQQQASECTQFPSIPIGARVQLRGLQAKPELNGRQGVVVKFMGSSGRYRVVMGVSGGAQQGEAFNLKKENLMVLVIGGGLGS